MSVAIENMPVNWITLEEQIMRLTQSKVAFESSMLRRTDSLLDTNLINCITDYFVELLPQLTNWHTALKKLDLLPDLVPALSDHILEILYSSCPIVEGKKVIDTHSLYLIPPNSLNDLEARVSAFGRDILHARNDNENPLRFRGRFKDEILQEHGNITSDRWEWILISNDVLEESRRKFFADQVKTVEDLSQRAMADYEVANLKQVASFLFLHKVATNESLYEHERGNAQNGNRRTYARVPEKKGRRQLVIGGSAPSGVFVDNYEYRREEVGVAVLRKFSRA